MAWGIEAIVLVLVCAAPWAFGAADPGAEAALYAGVGLLLVLWAARIVLQRRFFWSHCPVVLVLAALFLLAVGQITALPRPVLATLSPGTARLYDRLLPAQPEVLPGDVQAAAVHPPAGSSISLYPAATRRELVPLLAVCLLFAVVRNNAVSAAALRRLCLAALVNGALLSLFGLVQFFTSAHNLVYWSVATHGSVFGPFVNRNHFAFYANLCAGLGLGLLWGMTRPQLQACAAAPLTTGTTRKAAILAAVLDLLDQPQVLWISGALTLILGGVVLCLSRGGVVALLGAAAVCAVLGLRRTARLWSTGGVAVSVALALALFAWLGFDQARSRLSTLWTGEVFQDGRFFLLQRSWPVVKTFPVWGTGRGTFRYLEPLYFHGVQDVGRICEHAHNEYLEATIEGGLVQLALTVLLVVLVYRLGYRALQRQRHEPLGALLLGALFAFTAMVIHNFVDFGLRIPANALLATVVAAHLCGLANDRAERYELRGWGAAPLLAAATAVSLALVLVTTGWKLLNVEMLRAAAAGVAGEPLPSPEQQVAWLETAAHLAPDDADVQVALGQAHFDWSQQLRGAPAAVAKARTDINLPLPLWETVGVRGRSNATFNGYFAIKQQERAEQAVRAQRVAALEHFVEARNLCPLLPVPQVRIAANVAEFVRAETRRDYLARAKFLAPADPQLCYSCGLQELADGQPAQAWKEWRWSLELSDRFLAKILGHSAAQLDSAHLLRDLLPDRPELLLAAALQLYPPPDDSPGRQPFLAKAMALFAQAPGPFSPQQLRSKGILYDLLGQPARARAAYQAALAQAPLEVEWRCEFAQLLYRQGRGVEARREVVMVLGQQPHHAAARRIADTLSRDMAEDKLR